MDAVRPITLQDLLEAPLQLDLHNRHNLAVQDSKAILDYQASLELLASQALTASPVQPDNQVRWDRLVHQVNLDRPVVLVQSDLQDL